MTNYYDVLGVERTASEAAIRERFRLLARDAHPDRISDPAKKQQAEARFQLLTEAVNVLTNPARRKAHDFDLSKGGAGAAADPQAVAKVYLARGVKAYKEGDFATALEAFDMSVKHWDKDPKAHHYLALAAQKRPTQVRRGAEAIEAAIRLDPRNAAFRRDAGKLYIMAGMSLKAERHLEEALRWEPGDAEAQQLLTSLRSGTDSGRSRLGALFGRKG